MVLVSASLVGQQPRVVLADLGDQTGDGGDGNGGNDGGGGSDGGG